MSCRAVVRHLSAYLDGDLTPATSRAVSAHLAGCRACEERRRSLQEMGEMLAELRPLESPEPIAARVLDRIEVESRGPGLALVFRPRGAARPFILASLLPAALVLVAVVVGTASLGRSSDSWSVVADRLRGESWEGRGPASGTEANPLFPSSEIGLPRARGTIVPDRVFTSMGEGTLFLETVVARDGSVSNVTLLEGDVRQAGPLLDALRRERFEPVRLRGRPVAVSIYRLISRMEVWAPIT